MNGVSSIQSTKAANTWSERHCPTFERWFGRIAERLERAMYKEHVGAVRLYNHGIPALIDAAKAKPQVIAEFSKLVLERSGFCIQVRDRAAYYLLTAALNDVDLSPAAKELAEALKDGDADIRGKVRNAIAIWGKDVEPEKLREMRREIPCIYSIVLDGPAFEGSCL